jgi:hypothetical protein
MEFSITSALLGYIRNCNNSVSQINTDMFLCRNHNPFHSSFMTFLRLSSTRVYMWRRNCFPFQLLVRFVFLDFYFSM